MMSPRAVAGLLALGLAGCGGGSESGPPLRAEPFGDADYDIPLSRGRLAIKDAIVRDKLKTALLPAMRNHRIDMWIVLDRENNPDPLHDELGGGYSGAGAAFVFFDNGGSQAEKIYFGSQEQPVDFTISRIYDEKKYYGNDTEELKRLVGQAVQRRDPKRIGVNMSAALGAADGLTASLNTLLVQALGPRYAKRIVPAELLVHEFRARRTPLETQWYTKLQAWTSRWETEALAGHVKLGETTVLDLACWLEDRAVQLGLSQAVDHGRFPMIVWFGDRAGMPGLSEFEAPRALRKRGLPWTDIRDFPIEAGDLITVDGGLKFLGFVSDMKRTGYVLRSGETEPPASLQKAWRETLRIADLYAGKLVPGAVGQQVWRDLVTELRAQGFEVAGAGGVAAPSNRVEVSLYGHSVGNVVHDVGTRVAAPAAPPPSLEGQHLPLIEGEWVSVEFHLTTPVAEHSGQKRYTRFEQTGQVGRTGAKWLISRQEDLLVIGSGVAGRVRSPG